MPAPAVSTETRRQLKATAGELGAQTLPGAARPLQSGLDLADEAPDNEADSYVKIHQVVDLFFLLQSQKGRQQRFMKKLLSVVSADNWPALSLPKKTSTFTVV